MAEIEQVTTNRGRYYKWDGDFYKSVTKLNPRGVNVIAEVKKASPSAGLIRKDFDAVEIAQIYETCGADAISVLTDEKYFQGKLEYLTAVKEAVRVDAKRLDFAGVGGCLRLDGGNVLFVSQHHRG